MLQKIVVPLDGSPFGEQALPFALAVARRARIGIEVAHVHLPMAPIYREPKPGMESPLDLNLRKQGKAYLEKAISRIRSATEVPIKPVFLDGGVAEALQEYTAGQDALIVMTTHGRGPMKRFWIGSVADQLLRRTAVPVLLVHPREEGPPDLKRDVSLPRMLIPLDGTAESEEILEPAMELGRLMNSEFALLRVIEPLMLIGNDPMGYIVEVSNDTDTERRREEAAIHLERVAERMKQQGLKVRTRVVSGYHPAVSIADDAVAHAVSLIAMQTHGRQGLSRLLLGSVADKVLRSTSIPLLIHRPKSQ